MKSYNIAVLAGDGIGPEVMEEALRVADRILVMAGGEIRESFDISETPGPERRELIRQNILKHLNTKE